MRKMVSIVMYMAFLPPAYSFPALAESKWDVTRTMHIGGDGGWDYLTVDSQTHRYLSLELRILSCSTPEEMKPGATGRSKAYPDTFMIVEVGQKAVQ